jgi:hypothetical protein
MLLTIFTAFPVTASSVPPVARLIRLHMQHIHFIDRIRSCTILSLGNALKGTHAMSDFLPDSVRTELAAAQKNARRKRATRVVHIGDEAYPILEMTEDGFSVDADTAPKLRGFIDIYDGPRHLYQALIVASEQVGDLMRYEFKRNTAASASAPVDFERGEDRPSGLLPSA